MTFGCDAVSSASKSMTSTDFAPVAALLDAYEPAVDARPGHPYFAGAPCTMLVEEVETLWAPIAAADDWGPLEAKLAAIEQMRQAYGFIPD